MRRIVSGIIFAVAVTFAGGSASIAEPELVIQAATFDPAQSPYDNTKKATLMIFADYLEKISGGKIVCDLSFGTLGGDQEQFQQTMMGTINISTTTEGPPSSVFPSWSVINIPYLFDSEYVVDQVFDGAFGKEFAEAFREKSGLKVLAFNGNSGFRNIINNRHPINKLEDLKGMKFRTVNSPAQMKMFQLMGATAVPIAWGEVYTSVESGVIDGLNNNANGIFVGGLEGISKYITRDAHVYGLGMIVANDAWFSALTPEQQGQILEAAEVAKWASRVLIRLADATGYEKLANQGAEITFFAPEEKERIKNVVQPPFIEWLNTQVDPVWTEKLITAVAEVNETRHKLQ